MKPRRAQIAARFSAAASRYDGQTPIQHAAAARLASHVATLPLPAHPRVLEIGCGTGHLTRALYPLIGGDWVISDIAPAMVASCRSNTESARSAQWLVMDGESPAVAPQSFDLIVSSLAVQWFDNLPRALSSLCKLLADDGHLALTTLGADTFAEWRAAHATCGLVPATLAFPAPAVLAGYFSPPWHACIDSVDLSAPFGSPIDFLRGLRAIGADTPAAGTQPLSAGQLRRVLKSLSASGSNMTYQVLLVTAGQQQKT